MSNGTTLYRRIDEDLPILSYGKRHEIWQEEFHTESKRGGHVLIDFSSGPCCFSLGHSNVAVRDAIDKQMLAIPNAFSGWWASESSERAGAAVKREFEKMKPGWFGRVVFQQGGGEAVDFACKIAAQYHFEAGEKRLTFAARNFAYHGIGTMPAALSDFYPRYGLMEPYHEIARGQVVRLRHPIEPGHMARGWLNREVAAVIIEPVGGPTIAAWPDPDWYLRELREICDEFGILLIFDEILCGSGRCGHISVAEHYGVWPDMVILGKGLSAGYQPVSAIVLSQRIIDRIAQGSGQLMFGTAHGAHSMGCAAVAATLDYIVDHKLCELVREEGPLVRRYIEQEVGDIPIVRRVSGMGYLHGLALEAPELALEAPEGKPFDPSLQVHVMARKAILDEGVVVYTKGQTMHGYGDFVTMAPPFEMPSEVIKESVDRIAKALRAVSTRLGY